MCHILCYKRFINRKISFSDEKTLKMGDFYHHQNFVVLILTTLFVVNSIANKRNIVRFPDDIETVNSSEFIIEKLKEKSANPVVLLVEEQPESLNLASFFVENILSTGNHLNFWILTFNSTGVSNVRTSTENSIDNFKKTLVNLTFNSYLNQDGSNKSSPFFGTLHAAQILPKNSTVVVFSQAKFVDENLAQQAFNVVFTKMITVHLYWDDTELNLNHYLREISRLSGGQIFSLKRVGPTFENYKNSIHEKSLNSRLSILLTRKNQKQTNSIRFPLDSDVIGICVTVVPWEDTEVTLTSPTGYFMQFSDDDKRDAAKKYSFGSFSEVQGEYLDIHLNFYNSARPTVGYWTLKIDNPRRVYNVTVYGLTNITTRAFIDVKNEDNAVSGEKLKEIINIGVAGDVRTISEVIFVANDGHSIIEKITYKPTYENAWKKLELRNGDDSSTDTKDFDVELQNTSKAKPAYALVKGLDLKGNVFERLGSIFGFNKNLYPQQTINVDVGVGSQLLIVPGEQSQIYFEVSNRGNDAVNVFFHASDTRWILQSLSAYRRLLNPQESYIVTLTLTRQAGSGTYQDEITFTAKGGGQIVQKKALIDVGASQNYYDKSDPYLDHSYTSDCTEVIFKRCEQGTWTIEVTAQDADSGILQVNSVPKGLYIPNSYTAGTMDRVVGYYSDSCCNPNLQIIAVDRANNRRSYNVNAYYAIWSPGAIAALVLGILLFILLIALIVFLICRWKKTKETYDLPTYRGGDI